MMKSPPKSRHVDNKREVLLNAAERVAIRLGAAHLTLDAVAKEAKVGKGGLIYHFPSKKALFEAMLARAIGIYSQSAQANQIDSSNRGDYAQAYIRHLTSLGKRFEQLSTIIISIAVNDPELLQPLQKQSVAVYKNLAQDKTGDRAVVAILAVHGLFLMERLGIGPLKDKRRAQVIQALCEFARERSPLKKAAPNRH